MGKDREEESLGEKKSANSALDRSLSKQLDK
jgi:hypothetical protein